VRFIKRSARAQPKITLILLDWSVRESFHLLHYLARQDVPRDDFEVLVLEYYSRVSEAIGRYQDQIDTWALLEMPQECYYHKHLMYNMGIVLARGEICVICDSDAMVKPGFIRAIVEAFAREPNLVLHLDQFRNNRRAFYPFNFPGFDEVIGDGCINNSGGRTAGIVDDEDPIHTRNYGACMCARRTDLIEIGGADEHVDFVGHICGPYDMTFRLVNAGRHERWHQTEFLYHTWHPGQAGVDNYLGPHDGRHVSTTALAALTSGRVRPLLENAAIRRLRAAPVTRHEELLRDLIRPDGRAAWARDVLERGATPACIDDGDLHVGNYKGFLVYRDAGTYYAHLPLQPHRGRISGYGAFAEAPSLEQLRASIDRLTPMRAAIGLALTRAMVMGWQVPRFALRTLRQVLYRPRDTWGQGLRGLRELGKHAGRRSGQLAAEGRFLSDAIGDLIRNLCHLRLEPASGARQEQLAVVVEGRSTVALLRLLRLLGIVPRMRVLRVQGAAQVTAVMRELSGGTGASRLILSRGLYWRCYHSLERSDPRHAITVV
jgi:hypothetical protein